MSSDDEGFHIVTNESKLMPIVFLFAAADRKLYLPMYTLLRQPAISLGKH